MIAIMGAMPQEIEGLVPHIQHLQVHNAGMRTYYQGVLFGQDAVVVFSRWGKVAAATTALQLINQFKIKQLLFTGVAGAISHQLNIGDIVIGNKMYQHDMDARPLMARFEIPLLGKTYFEADSAQNEHIFAAISALFSGTNHQNVLGMAATQKHAIVAPKVCMGDIASGDKFFSQHIQKTQLTDELPSVLCVEMEGAAVAQVCFEYGVPFNIVRVISDAANTNSAIDFSDFISNIASQYTVAIVKELLTAQ